MRVPRDKNTSQYLVDNESRGRTRSTWAPFPLPFRTAGGSHQVPRPRPPPSGTGVLLSACPKVLLVARCGVRPLASPLSPLLRTSLGTVCGTLYGVPNLKLHNLFVRRFVMSPPPTSTYLPTGPYPSWRNRVQCVLLYRSYEGRNSLREYRVW